MTNNSVSRGIVDCCMRVLLVEPPFHRFMGFYRHYYPLGLAYIASTLAKHNHVVEILDAEHDRKCRSLSYLQTSEEYFKYLDAINDSDHSVWSEIQREISRFEPDLVGISALSVKTPSALRIASLCHLGSRKIPVVVGGEHPTARPEDFLRDNNVSFLVRGEGERTILELVETLKRGGRLENIDGLSFKTNGEVIHNKNRPLVENLDSLPFPARNFLSNKETYRPVDFGLIMGSRGCPYRCSFCPNQNLWGRRVRYRLTSNIIDEIKSVQETYSTQYFSFRDYSFSTDNKRTIDLCRKIRQEKLDIQWECTTRPDLITEETVSLMKDAGCTTIRVGIESGSDRILVEIKKDLSIKQIKEASRILNRHNIYWAAYFMFGLPSETKEDIKKTFTLIDEIDPPFVSMARYTPEPGSELYETLVRKGRVCENEVDWGQWSNQWLENAFTERISREEFREIIQDVARHVDEHNKRHSPNKVHPLLKFD